MVAIPFPTISTVGGRPQEGGGRLLNAMVEKLSDGARQTIVRKRVPGLRLLVQATGATGCRGFIAVGGVTLVALSNKLWKIAKTGTAYAFSEVGSLAGDRPVTFAKNNKSPTPDIVCVTENGAFKVFTDSAPISYPDLDVGFPNSVAFMDGYFLFTYGDATIRASGLNTTDIDPLDYTTAQFRSDGLLRGVTFRQEYWAFGPASIEVYQNTAQELGFPLSRSAVIPRGLIGPWAVAGWEEGFANTLIWVGDDNVVYRMNGYAPERISTHDIERVIEAVNVAGAAENLKAFVYMSEGHAFWALKYDTWCWVFDTVYGTWHERSSYQSSTWRGQHSVKAFGQWLIGDGETGTVWFCDAGYYREGDAPMQYEVVSAPANAFPNRVFIPRVDFDMDPGVGVATGQNPIETDPVVRVSWTNDGGFSWSQPVIRRLGAMGKSHTRITVNRTGMAQPTGRLWKLEVSDPVYVGILGGEMQVDVRAL